MNNLVENGTLVNGMPIKLQTLAEKAMLVKNFKECYDTYSEWSIKYNQGNYVSLESLELSAIDELNTWYTRSL